MATDNADSRGKLAAPRRRLVNPQLMMLSVGMIGAPAAGLLVGLGVFSLRTVLPIIAAVGFFAPVLSLGLAAMLRIRPGGRNQSPAETTAKTSDSGQPTHEVGIEASGKTNSRSTPPHAPVGGRELSEEELQELLRVVEERLGVTAAATPAPAAAAASEEQAEFSLILAEAGTNKIGVTKIVNDITELGVLSSKRLVEAAPTVIKTAMPKADAEAGKKRLEDAGAIAELRPREKLASRFAYNGPA